MKKTTRWLALALSTAMIAGLTACGNTETQESSKTGVSEEGSGVVSESQDSSKEVVEEPVTLEWWYRGNGIQKDTELVEEKFNELLKTYPGMENVTVNFNCYTGAEYKNAVILAQSAQQQMDILNTVSISFTEEVEKGTYIALDDLLEENETLKNELPQWLWDLGKVGDSTYIVPNYQRASNMMYFITPKEYMDKYGDIDATRELLQSEDRTVEEVAAMLEEYLLDVREGEGEGKYLMPLGNHYVNTFGFTRRFDAVGPLMKAEGSTVVEYPYLTDEAKAAFAVSADWFEKGYIPADIETLDSATYRYGNMMNENSFIVDINNQAGSEEEVSAYYSTAWGIDVYAIPLHTNYYITNVWAAGGNGITATCEHPDKALRLIELMTTEEGVELYNMMVYGLEGTHYEKIDDTHIKTLEYDGTQGGVDSSYAAMKWIIGNTFHAYLNQGCKEGENELALEINENPNNSVSDLMGFIPNVQSVQTQIDQITAVTNEYGGTLQSGIMESDWETTYNEYVDKMNAAGLQDILDELQGQVDAFLAN